MKKAKPNPITSESFSIFEKLDDWKIYEIPREYWGEMDYLPRQDDLVAVYASGCQQDPTRMHNQFVSAGMDAIAVEPNPKQESRYGHEPDLNVYHMVFQKLDRKYGEFQYLAYGPFNFGALQDHWPKNEEDALEFYIGLGRKLEGSS